jgi:threonine synthase
VLEAARGGEVYASHAYLPQGLPGFSTIAYEIFNEIGEAPGSVVMPVGHGSLLLGIFRGFQALKTAGLLAKIPEIVGVQAGACDPLFQAFQEGEREPVQVPEGETLAEGVRISNPHRGVQVLRSVRESKGRIVSVSESTLKSGRQHLAALGFYVEWTSALVWDGIAQVLGEVSEPIVAVLTGHGLKGG